MLYGGDFETCSIYVGGHRTSCGDIVEGAEVGRSVNYIRNVISNDNVTSDIASDPIMVCSCRTCRVTCPLSGDYGNIEIVRGENFSLLVVVVSQDAGVVPSAIRIILDNDVRINPSQRIQLTDKTCTLVSYRLFGEVNTSRIDLLPVNSPCSSARTMASVDVTFLPCPDGFVLKGSECACDDRLQRFHTTCNVDDRSIERTSNAFWIDALYNNGSYEGLIIHSGCPFDYCVSTPVNITLDDLNAQCDHNHSGMLCGSCKDDFSISLGTLHCLECSNSYLALILFFALAGVGLVALLLVLNVSVASGTINDLIFFANIVQANHSAFFPVGMTNILTVFIAWLNLDYGIETCFYHGMTTYAYIWLQFLFPFYVWFLIGLIIVASRYSVKISRSLGTHPVTVLATLLLLSYSKLLLNIIAVLTVTRLEFPDGTIKGVWFYDGSVPYFEGADHGVLGIFSILVLVFLFLPYTFLLLFSPWLQRYSHWKMLSWLNKIKPFLDAYHAPYKKETRYWTGFLLLVRCSLFFTFAFNTLYTLDLEFVLIISHAAGLATLSLMHGGIYQKLHNNIIEAFLLLNLIIFAAASDYVRDTGRSQAPVANMCIGITLVSFIIILLYHSIMRLRGTTWWKELTKQVTSLTPRWYGGSTKESDMNLSQDQGSIKFVPVQVSSSSVALAELRESMLIN